MLNPLKIAFPSGFNPYFRNANSEIMKRRIAIAAFISILMSCENKSNTKMALDYPNTPKVDTVDTYFDTAVPDPYRWLEDDMSPETESWVGAQNEVTFSFLDKIPYREALKNRLEELWNYEKLGTPFKAVSYTHLTLPTMLAQCRSRWSADQ